MATKKDFIAMAKIIREGTFPPGIVPFDILKKDDFIERLCEYYRGQNSAFSANRFIDACKGGAK